MWQRPPDSVAESIRKQNDAACRDVLKATGVDSEKALEALIQRGSDVEPDQIRIHILDDVASALGGEVNLWTAESDEEEFFRYGVNTLILITTKSRRTRRWSLPRASGTAFTARRKARFTNWTGTMPKVRRSSPERSGIFYVVIHLLTQHIPRAGAESSMLLRNIMLCSHTVVRKMGISTGSSGGNGSPSSDQTVSPISGSSIFLSTRRYSRTSRAEMAMPTF